MIGRGQTCVNTTASVDWLGSKQGQHKRHSEGYDVDQLLKRCKGDPEVNGRTLPVPIKQQHEDKPCLEDDGDVRAISSRKQVQTVTAPSRRTAGCGRLPGLRPLTGVTGVGLLGRMDAGSGEGRKTLGLGLGLQTRSDAAAGPAGIAGRNEGTRGVQPASIDPPGARPCLLSSAKTGAEATSTAGRTAGPWLPHRAVSVAPGSAPASAAFQPQSASTVAPGRVLTSSAAAVASLGRAAAPVRPPASGLQQPPQSLGGSANTGALAAGNGACEGAVPAPGGCDRSDDSCAADVSSAGTESCTDSDFESEADSGSSCDSGSASGACTIGTEISDSRTTSDDEASSGDATGGSMAVDSDDYRRGGLAKEAAEGPAPPPKHAAPGPATAAPAVTPSALAPTPTPELGPAPMLDGLVRRGIGARDPAGPPWLLFPRNDRCLRFSKTAACAIWPQLMASNPCGRIPVTVHVVDGGLGPHAEPDDGRRPANVTAMRLYMRIGGNARMSLRGFPRWPLLPCVPWQSPLQISVSPTGDGALVEVADEAVLARHRLRVSGRVPRTRGAAAAAAAPTTTPAAAGPAAAGGEGMVAPGSDGAGGSGRNFVYGAGRGGVVGCGDGPDLVLRVRLSAKSFNPNAYMILPGGAAQHFFNHLLRPASGTGAQAGAGPAGAGVAVNDPSGPQQVGLSPVGGADGSRVQTVPGVGGAAASVPAPAGGDAATEGGQATGAAGGHAVSPACRRPAGVDGLVRSSAMAHPLPNLSHDITLIPEAWPEMRFKVFLRYRFPALHDLPTSVCLPRASIGPGAVTPLVLYGAVPGDVMELWQRPEGATGEYLCRVVRSDGRGVRGPPAKQAGEPARAGQGEVR